MIDGVFFSHVVVWSIGALTAVGAVLTAGAFWSMGRSGYRQD